MLRSLEIESQRRLGLERRVPMQKLEITGHLLPGTDISARNIQRFLEDLGPVCGMNIFNGPHVKTPDSYDSKTLERLGGKAPEDVNGSLMWDDSGAQLYVFPNSGNFFTVDIYTCKSFDAQEALRFVYDRLHPREDMAFGETNYNIKTPWTEYTRPDGAPLNPESAYLPEIDQLFDRDITDINDIMDAGQRLESIVARAVADGVGDRVAASYTPAQREQLRSIHSDYEVAVDYRFMDDVLSGVATNPDQYHFQPRYDRLAMMEGQAIGLDNRRRVIHIGTGWPGTAIGLYRQFGTPVTCIEIDSDLADKSRKALERIGLLSGDKLQVVNYDGVNVNPEGNNAVIVSAMVPKGDKELIIKNMRDLASGQDSDPMLVLRTPSDNSRALFYQELGREPAVGGGFRAVTSTAQMLQQDDPLKSYACRVRERASTFARGEDKYVVRAEKRLQRV